MSHETQAPEPGAGPLEAIVLPGDIGVATVAAVARAVRMGERPIEEITPQEIVAASLNAYAPRLSRLWAASKRLRDELANAYPGEEDLDEWLNAVDALDS